MEIWIERGIQRKKRKDCGQRVGKVIWDWEREEKFRKKLKGEKREGKQIYKEWREMEEEIKKALREVEEKQRERVKKRKVGWWDEVCRNKKKEVREEVRKWRMSNKGKEKYREKKREYGKLCEQKKKEETERWMKDVKQAKREKKVWKIVNKERKERKGIDEGIEEEEWKEYFMRLLRGVEHRIREREMEEEEKRMRNK